MHSSLDNIKIGISEQIQFNDLLNQHHESYSNLSVENKMKILIMAGQIRLGKKIPIKFKPTRHVLPEMNQCHICCVDYVPNDRLAECQQCKKQLHFNCMIQWCHESIHLKSVAKCPFCISDWKDGGKILIHA